MSSPSPLKARFSKHFAGGARIEVAELSVFGNGCVSVLFGPSGSGKSTVLRCLAGLEVPDEGTIAWGDTTWFDSARRICLPARVRNIGFVPQNYALFPHLNLAGNIGYGIAHLGASERSARVTETLEWLGLAGLEGRFPSQLSGGEQQRVALARAVVRRPALLLLDEPLSALDSPTRVRLRSELRRWLLRLSIPTILVTHDRTEAVAIGDDLVVMHAGRVVQQGCARDVFNRPVNAEVAGILSVESVLSGIVLEESGGMVRVRVGEVQLLAVAPDLPPGTRAVHVCIRAEDVIVAGESPTASSARNRLKAVVIDVTEEPPMVRVDLDCGFPLTAVLTRQAAAELHVHPGARAVALVKAPHVHLVPGVVS